MERVPGTGLSPPAARLPRRVPLRALRPSRRPYNPGRASTPPVWAGPLSLAATRGVTVVFLSSGYLDVSVRRVRLRNLRMPCLRTAGFPIRASADPWLLAPPRGISPPAAPFLAPGSHGHPPCALSRSLAAKPHGSRPSAPFRYPLARGHSHAPRSRVSRVLSFVVVSKSCVLLSSLSHPVNEPSRHPCRVCGECGARTHDPRLAKPVL